MCDTLSRQKSAHSGLLEPPCFTEVCLPCENITKTCNTPTSSKGKCARFLHLENIMSSNESRTPWNLLRWCFAEKNNDHQASVTSGVQAGGSLAAVQLPLLDFEVRTGPFQARMAPQLCEELLHGALVGPTAAHRRSTFPYTGGAAAAATTATSTSVPGS